jgi:hypothetical protein
MTNSYRIEKDKYKFEHVSKREDKDEFQVYFGITSSLVCNKPVASAESNSGW